MLRLLFAASLGLGIDESYMVAAGRRLQLSYFDHPPIAWWLAWAAAHLLGSDRPIVVRLPFILLFALTTWLMYRVTAALFGARAGLWAAVLANLCPVIGVTAASWVLPDGPLFAALLGAALCLIAALPAAGMAAWGWWLGAGICAGLALSSKYSAGLTILGAVGFLLSERSGRGWLLRPHPYVAGLAALVMFAPVLIWNAEHGWVSLLFQGGRAGGRFNPFGPFVALAGGALFMLPWIWLPLMLCGYEAWRRGPADPGRWLLLCLAAPPIVFFTMVALWSHVLFHWAAPGYLLAAAVARRRDRPPPGRPPRPAAASGAGSRRPRLWFCWSWRSSPARSGSTGCRRSCRWPRIRLSMRWIGLRCGGSSPGGACSAGRGWWWRRRAGSTPERSIMPCAAGRR